MPKVKDGKKGKKLKDPDAPKRPLSAYFIWLGEFRTRMKVERPEIVRDVKIFGVTAGEEWKKVTLEEREPFQARHLILKANYAEQMKHYVAPKGFKGSNKKVRDPLCPKKPSTAFFLFMADNRERIKQEHPGIAPAQIGKILGEEWKFFDPIRKREYEKIYEGNLDQWRKDKADYDANCKANAAEEQPPPPQQQHQVQQHQVQHMQPVQQIHQQQQVVYQQQDHQQDHHQMYHQY